MALGRRKPGNKKAVPAKKTGPSRREKLKQLSVAFTMTRKADATMLPLVVGTFVVVLAVFVLLGVLVSHPVTVGVFGVFLAALAALVMFGRRVQKTAYSQVDGQLGVAAAIVERMRGNWRVTPAVGFTKEQDLVHRVIGTPGIVLISEGAPNRTRGLVVAEKKRLSRVVGETPIYDVAIGDGEGQVALKNLERHVLKLPKNIKPAQVNALEARLKALTGPSLPIPKGPMPTRVQRR